MNESPSTRWATDSADPIADIKGDRCTGDCCRVFSLPFSPEEIQENYRAWRNQDFDKDRKDENGHTQFVDIWLVAPMVRHVGLFRAGDTPPSRERPKLKADAHFYRCAHLDGDNCGIYDMRPEVCRNHPNRGRCLYPGCSWDKVRNGTPEGGK